MVELVERLRAEQATIQQLLTEQQLFKRPWSGVSEQEMEQFTNQLLRLQGYVKNIAFAANNKEDLANLPFIRSDFKRRGAQYAYNLGHAIVAVAERYADALKQYTDGEQLLAECKELVSHNKEFSLLAPSERRKRLKETTEQIAAHQKVVSAVLKNQVDSLMLSFAAKDELFYSSYLANRIIPKFSSGRSVTGDPTEPVIPEVVEPVAPPAPPVGELGGGSLPGLPGGDAPPSDDGGEG